MKQRLLKATALLVLMFSCTAAIAQIRYTSAVHHSTIPGIQNGYGCPVRYWKNDMSVAFVKQSPIDGERFISMRSGVVFLEDRTVSLPHSTPSCPGNNIIPVSLIRKLPPKQYPSTGTLGLVNINHNLAIIALVSPPVTTNCNSYE